MSVVPHGIAHISSAEHLGKMETVAGIVLGTVSVVLGFIPLIGLASGIAGLLLTLRGRAHPGPPAYRRVGTAGFVASVIGIAWGAIMFALWVGVSVSAGYLVTDYSGCRL